MRSVLTAIILALTLPLAAQEKVTLATPETVPPNQAYRIESVLLIADDPATPAADGHINIRLVGIDRPATVDCQYGTTTMPTGTALLNGLNKANLSTAYAGTATTGSLKQRIFHRLVVMGESATVCTKAITGSLSGNPE